MVLQGRLRYCHAPPGIPQEDFFPSAENDNEVMPKTAENTDQTTPSESVQETIPKKVRIAFRLLYNHVIYD